MFFTGNIVQQFAYVSSLSAHVKFFHFCAFERMLEEKSRNVRQRALDIIRDSGAAGIGQKELEKALGISKSYCSEVLSSLNEEKLIKKTDKKGSASTIYLYENYPGRLEGTLRTGLLKSSEYIPTMAFLMEYASSENSKMLFRFYNSTMELIDDLRRGALEFALAPTNALILSALLTTDLKICSGVSSGGSGIIISGNWDKDAILSTEVSSMISMSLHAPEEGLPEEIETFSDPEKGISKFVEEKYRAIAIWEPYLSIFREKFKPERIVDYESIMDRFPCCSLATTRSFWMRYGEDFGESIAEFMKGNTTGFENIELIRKSINIISEKLNVKPEIVERSMGSYDFTSRKISRGMLAGLGISLSKRQESQIFTSGLLVYDR